MNVTPNPHARGVPWSLTLDHGEQPVTASSCPPGKGSSACGETEAGGGKCPTVMGQNTQEGGGAAGTVLSPPALAGMLTGFVLSLPSLVRCGVYQDPW